MIVLTSVHGSVHTRRSLAPPPSTDPVMRKWSVILAVTAAVLALSAGAWRSVQSGELQVAPLAVGVLMIALAFLFAHNAPGAHHN